MASSKRKASGSLFRNPLVVVTILAVLLLFITTLFQVTEIEVRGAENYSKQEVIQASRIEEGDGLFFLNRIKSASSIFAKLPYIDEVTISTKFPGKVIIQIKEAEVLAYIEQDGKIWGVDPNGVIIGQIEEDVADLIRVSGVRMDHPKEEERLENVCSDTEAVAVLCDILKAVDSRVLGSEISSIEMKDPAMPKLLYGNFTVVLDGASDFNYQLAMVQNAVSQLGAKEKGSLDLTIDDRVHFTPVK